MVVGCALVIAAAIALGVTMVYWWFHPEARERSFEVSTQVWERIRTEVDSRTVQSSERRTLPSEPEVPEIPVQNERAQDGERGF